MTFGESFLSDRPRRIRRPYWPILAKAVNEVSTYGPFGSLPNGQSVERLGSRIIVVTIVKHVGKK